MAYRWPVSGGVQRGVSKYQARLTESGLAVEDSIVLCAEYRLNSDWKVVKSKAMKDNLLGKGSRSRISKLLRAVERRIFEAPSPLDRPIYVTRFLAAEKNVPTAAKSQLLLVLAVNDDLALADAHEPLHSSTEPRLVQRPSQQIH
jgi:hypothetical protein